MFGKIVNKIFAKRIDQQVGTEVQRIKRQLGYRDVGNYTFGAGGEKWFGGLAASGQPILLDHALLRANARRAYHDSVQAKSIIERLSDSIADVGLRLESSPRANILGITEQEAESWASEVEDRFDAWAASKKQHRSEQINWYQSHRQNVIYQQRDGEVFQRLYYSMDNGLQNPLQFSFIDPVQIYSDEFTSTSGYTFAGDGITRDSRGREQGYKIWIKNGKYKPVNLPVRGKSGYPFILHAFAAEYAGQGRGYSRLAHALQEFQNITDFSAAQVKKAINQSNLVMYVKPGQDNPASNPYETIQRNIAAGPIQQYGSIPNPAPEANNVTEESTQPVSCYRLPEATFETPGSAVVANLEEGEEIKPGPNNAPVESYDKFVDSFTAYLAASLSIPIEVVLMRFNQNYSASRASLILFWRTAKIWQDEMAADVLNPTYEAWLSGEIALGRIQAPGWSDPVMRAAWLHCNWIGAPMPNIDPKRTADADRAYVEMGAQTLDRVARDYNGSDGTANRAKLAREFDELPSSPWQKIGLP